MVNGEIGVGGASMINREDVLFKFRLKLKRGREGLG